MSNMSYIHFACVLIIVNSVYSVGSGAEIKRNERPVIGELLTKINVCCFKLIDIIL